MIVQNLFKKRYSSMSYLPLNVPQIIELQNGVFVLELTFEKILNISPSDDIQYNIRGNGNNVPIMLRIKLKIIRKLDNS